MTRAARRAFAAVTVALVPVVALSVLAATGNVEQPVAGLPDAGSVTRWGLPLARAVHDAAATVTVGLLVLAATVLPAEAGTPEADLGATRTRAVRLAAVSGTIWALAGAAYLAFTYSDVAAMPLDSPDFAAQLRFFVIEFDLGRSLAVSVALATISAVGCWTTGRITVVGLLALSAVAALLPLALTGHAAGASNHEAAVDAQAAHLIGVSVWVGGLAGLAVLRRRLGNRFAATARRYSVLAGWCFGMVAISGLVSAAVRVDGWSGLFSTYGALLAAKTLALAILGVAGWRQRRRVLTRLESDPGSLRVFGRLAAGELVVMAVAIGLAVALARTSPTSPLAEPERLSRSQSLLGYPMPPPLGAAEWFTQWRIDSVWVPVAVVGIGLYLRAVLRLRRRGDRWPVGRTASWLFGWIAMIWVTSAGPGVYDSVMFSMHMVQHMTIAMLIPIFLVLGAPVTLALRTLPARKDGSRGPREWLLLVVHSPVLRVLAHPVVAGVLVVGSLVVFYYSPAFELALRTHSGHVLMTLHFLLTGYLFAWVIAGPDPGPRRPHYLFRMVMLMVTMAFHAFIGIAMMDSASVLGEEWFAAAGRPWGPSLEDDQNTGGALAWALGDYPIAILILAMIRAWISDDAREARRYDRQADRDGDAQLAAYNAYLHQVDQHGYTSTPRDIDSGRHDGREHHGESRRPA